MKKKFTIILGVALPLVMVIALAVTLIPASQPSADAAVTKLRFSTVATPRVGSGGKYWLTPDVDVGAIAIAPDGRTMFATDVSTLTATASVDEPVSGNVSADATSINATNTDYYRASGVVAIDSELIFYSSTSATHLLYCTRGYADTTAALHLDGATITEVPMVYKSADGGYTWSLLEGFLSATAPPKDLRAIVDVATSPEYSSDSTLFVATDNAVYQSVNGGTSFSSMAVPALWGANEQITGMNVALDEGGRLSVIIGSEDTTAAYAGEVYVYCPATTGMGWKAQRVDGSASTAATKTEDVLAVAFTPNFATDGGIVAVTCNGTTANDVTKMRLSFGNTRDGGGWDTSVGDAEFYHNSKADRPIIATRASFAFPEDFNIDSLTSNVAFVGLTGSTVGPALAEAGDVFKASLLTGVPSDVEDLNVRGIVVATPTETDIYSIGVSGDAEAANILVGLNDWDSRVSPKRWLTYYTNDSGATWLSARIKSPTGGTGTWVDTALRAGADAETRVLMSPTDDNVVYAATRGALTSALSRSSDNGKSWNQISLIDYATSAAGYAIAEYSPMGKGIVGMATGFPTFKDAGAHWLSADDGATFERISSYVNPTLTESLATRKGVKGTDVVYLCDSKSGKYWRSSDAGVSFPRTVTAKYPGIKKDDIVDETTIYTVYETKGVWYTTTLGRPWVQALEGPPGTLTNLVRCKAVGVEGVWLVPNAAGEVYITIDDCKTFTKLGMDDPLANVAPSLQFDENYAKNHYVYASVGYTDEKTKVVYAGGLYRIEVNEDDPDSTEWLEVAVDTIHEDASIGKLSSGKGAVWMATDGAPVVSDNIGGFWRSVNADADLEGLYPPEFELVGLGFGLTAGETIEGVKGPPAPPPTSYYLLTPSNYYNQVVAFMDTLGSPVTLVEPADKATAGIGLDLTLLTQTVLLSWETLPGARQYKAQVAIDEEFASKDEFTTTGTQYKVGDLMPGRTYYWRVRAEEPIWSPWSGTRSFTIKPIVPVEVPVVFEIIGPEVGATNVPVQPTFAWTEYKGAIGYEIALSEQADFSILEWSRTTEVTFFKAPDPLAYSTTYYWRVRGVTGPPAPAPPKGPPKEGPPPPGAPPKEGKPGGPPGGGPPPGAPPKEGPPPEGAPPAKGPPGKPPKPPAMVVPTGPWVTGMFTTEARPVEVVPPVEVAPPAPPEVQVVEVPVAPAIPPALLWVIVAIGAVLLIALIVLIVRTRRVT